MLVVIGHLDLFIFEVALKIFLPTGLSSFFSICTSYIYNRILSFYFFYMCCKYIYPSLSRVFVYSDFYYPFKIVGT